MVLRKQSIEVAGRSLQLRPASAAFGDEPLAANQFHHGESTRHSSLGAVNAAWARDLPGAGAANLIRGSIRSRGDILPNNPRPVLNGPVLNGSVLNGARSLRSSGNGRITNRFSPGSNAAQEKRD